MTRSIYGGMRRAVQLIGEAFTAKKSKPMRYVYEPFQQMAVLKIPYHRLSAQDKGIHDANERALLSSAVATLVIIKRQFDLKRAKSRRWPGYCTWPTAGRGIAANGNIRAAAAA